MIQGSLFTRDFLEAGIEEQPVWASLDVAELDRLAALARGHFHKVLSTTNASEPVTESDLIYPLLAEIGWRDLVFVQPNASKKGRSDVPDALLFGDPDALDRGRAEPDAWKRFRHGICLVEAKKWNLVLDREAKREDGVPSTQMLRYLRRVDDITEGRLRWGILTNGRCWRLYFQGSLSVSEDFLEIDLGKVLDLPGCELDLLDRRGRAEQAMAAERRHAFKLFVILFGRQAFLPSEAGASFHAIALQEGKKWESRVAHDLADQVFDEVFPKLADGLAKSDPMADRARGPDYLTELRQATLILLYRILFVLFAEDRNLLPDEVGNYADYCLTRIRKDVAERMAAGRPFPASASTFWPRLQSIFRAIADGDDDLGIPPYNGGLFDAGTAPLLERARLNDAVVADVVFRLSHRDEPGRAPRYINYRDLSVQQLGSVYEQILEHGLQRAENGSVVVAADASGRRASGSYYTPEELVGLIIQRAVGPLVAERVAAFEAKAAASARDSRSIDRRLAELSDLDPASRLLDLKICDPAMGSGHFLVSLVDWLADAVLAAMAEAAAAVTFADYVSPLAERIAVIRAKIASEARVHRWPIVEAQLDDRHIVRRMVLKRVVYGVDKNPMAVELAKVALWLHSFTVGAPLSFLDHHLRCGDSVVGAWTRPLVDRLTQRGALFSTGSITKVENVSRLMAEIEDTTDNDIAEVASSKAKFETVEEATTPVAGFFSLMTAESLMGVFDAAPKREPRLITTGTSEKAIRKAQAERAAFERAAAFRLALEGAYGDPLKIASGEIRITPKGSDMQFRLLDREDMSERPPELFGKMNQDARRRAMADDLVAQARAIAARHGFFHWEIGFPNVWSNLLSTEPQGGFDAVIGNPPYVRQERIGEIKPALEQAYAAFDGMADLYVYFYEQGLRLLRPGGRMSYVVTNKWLKAGYAEELRALFTDPARAELEFIADFGHAKHFFPTADVFPSVIVVRKPAAPFDDPPAVGRQAEICVIPRDAVPAKGLSAAVDKAIYKLPLAMFSKESWTLEPPAVMALLDKIRRNGVPLAEYAGVKPLYGIKTGLNEAFLIDTPTRDRLVGEDPTCAEIIKPYLRGQDIERWASPDSGLFMILLKSSSDHAWPWANALNEHDAEKLFKATYPSLHAHMKPYETWVDLATGKKKGLKIREDHGKFWWELRSCAYYDYFDKVKIMYQEIQFHPSFSFDIHKMLGNNKTFFLVTEDLSLLSILNSPVMWWHNWRYLPHMKDEALTPTGAKMETMPIVADTDELNKFAMSSLESIHKHKKANYCMKSNLFDWLRIEFGIGKPRQVLDEPFDQDADAFLVAVRAALPKRQKLSAADIARLRQEWTTTIVPARAAAAEILTLERRLSDLVNAAYGLTPEEVQLMWQTAPPRMPLDPAMELQRLRGTLVSRPPAPAQAAIG